MEYLCTECGHPSTYQAFSGGREWFCTACDASGSYPEAQEKPLKHCLACGEEQGYLYSPADGECAGTVFTAHGNYGSTVFDPMDLRYRLQILICDECMKSKAESVVLVRKDQPQPTYTRTTWNPEETL